MRWQEFLLAVGLMGCSQTEKGHDSGGPPLVDPTLLPMIWPMAERPALPDDSTNRWADDETVAWFGRYLYYDTRLSSAGEFSCATCHDPEQGTGDGRSLSQATGTTARHAPALWNVAYQRWLYWDGRCDSLWCQATGPVEAELEMDLTRVELARVISEEPDLAEAYTLLFGPLPDVSDRTRFPDAARPVAADPSHTDHRAWDTMTPEDQAAVTTVLVSVTKAIAAYERTLVTAQTRVDQFIHALRDGRRADAEAALSEQERWGLELFAGEGECVFCHSGWAFSNKEFHNLALPSAAGVDSLDTGRYEGIDRLRDHPFNSASAWSDAPMGDTAQRLERIAQTTEQLGQFKTPSLREVASHPPYMHGGHFETLGAVVAFYSDPGIADSPGHRDELVVARSWNADAQAAVVAFLEALSSAEPADAALIRAPTTALP